MSIPCCDPHEKRLTGMAYSVDLQMQWRHLLLPSWEWELLLWRTSLGPSKGREINAEDARDTGSISESGRSPGVGNGNSLQNACLKSSRDRGAWRATIHGGPKSQTRLSNWGHIQFYNTSFILKYQYLISAKS